MGLTVRAVPFMIWGEGRNEVKNVVRGEQGVPKNVCRGEQYPHPDRKKSCKGLFSRQKNNVYRGVYIIFNLIKNVVWG